MSLRKSDKQSVCDIGECEDRLSSATENNEDDNPSLEYKYEFYLKGLREYDKFLRDRYFDVYHKEIEFQLRKDGLIYYTEFYPNATPVKNYENYKKFLIHEHNKIIAVELGEERIIRENMLASCKNMKWSSVVKIFERRQKIMMKRKQALLDEELAYIEERNRIMLRYQYYKENDGLTLFLKENKLADYLTAQSLREEIKFE